MEGNGTNFEKQPNDHENNAQDEDSRAISVLSLLRNTCKSEVAGGGVHHHNAIQHNGGCQHTQQEVLQRSLLAKTAAVQRQSTQNIERQGHGLQSNKQHEEVVCCGEEHHTEEGEQGEDINLGVSSPFTLGNILPVLRMPGAKENHA